MIRAMATFIGFACLGNIAARVLHLPIPGPVLGLIGLAASLLALDALRRRPAGEVSATRYADLRTVAAGLIGTMSLMFVPAGVGVVNEAAALRRDALPIAAGLLGSTLVSLWVTGAVLTLWLRRFGADLTR